MSRILRVIAVSIFIIGFPLVSWYYLNEGYKYRISIIEELNQQLGTMPNFRLVNQKGAIVDNKLAKEKIVIVNFMDAAAVSANKIQVERLYTIQDQFDKKDDILFYTYIKADSLKIVQDYVQTLNIKEEKQWNFLTGAAAEMDAFLQAFPLPESTTKVYAGNPTVAIVDTIATVRFFYDLADKKAASKLIEHIANLMPQAPPEEARMKRELEK